MQQMFVNQVNTTHNLFDSFRSQFAVCGQNILFTCNGTDPSPSPPVFRFQDTLELGSSVAPLIENDGG
jgi:hypothetical protein